jgi:sec-independent protein translocase protein TatA
MMPGFITVFFNISGGEIFIILLIVFIVFGPAKIPEVARSLGRMMNEVKKASSDISREFRKETSAIERDFKKTATEVSKGMDPLTEDPLKEPKKRVYDPHEDKIPDAYLKEETTEIQPPENDSEEEEKTEKPIQ